MTRTQDSLLLMSHLVLGRYLSLDFSSQYTNRKDRYFAIKWTKQSIQIILLYLRFIAYERCPYAPTFTAFEQTKPKLGLGGLLIEQSIIMQLLLVQFLAFSPKINIRHCLDLYVNEGFCCTNLALASTRWVRSAIKLSYTVHKKVLDRRESNPGPLG